MNTFNAKQEKSQPVKVNLEVLLCSLEDCDTTVSVHKKYFASLSNCGREDCPNGRKHD